MHYIKDDIIKDFGYDPSDEASILTRAKDLIGLSVLNVMLMSPFDNKTKLDPKNKGAIGNIIEEHWFGIKNNPSPEPDFIDAGIELKVIPLEKRKSGLSVKERTKICSINYSELLDETWKTSHVKRKLNKILFIYYQYNPENKSQSMVKHIDLWELRGTDEAILRQDWEKIKKKVEDGQAHLISESDSKILAACRSGRGGVDRFGIPNDMVTQPKNIEVGALRRAFSLKQSFTRQRWLQIHDKVQFESVIQSLTLNDKQDFEKAILEKLDKTQGMTLGDFAQKFNIAAPEGKNAAATIIKKALGFKNVNSRIKEFEQSGIEVRIVPVRTSDKKPWEAVSFPTIKLKEFVDEPWDESPLQEYVDRILFIPIYRDDKKTPLNDRALGKAFFWSPSEQEWDTIKEEWQMYKEEVQEGNCKVTKVKSGNSHKEITSLSKESSTKMIHIRPHGKNRDDRDEDSFGNSVVKQSFWLNKNFVHDLMKKYA